VKREAELISCSRLHHVRARERTRAAAASTPAAVHDSQERHCSRTARTLCLQGWDREADRHRSSAPARARVRRAVWRVAHSRVTVPVPARQLDQHTSMRWRKTGGAWAAAVRHEPATVLRGAHALARTRATHTPGKPSSRSALLPLVREWLSMSTLPGCRRLSRAACPQAVLGGGVRRAGST
jgi:hypothetical protein